MHKADEKNSLAVFHIKCAILLLLRKKISNFLCLKTINRVNLRKESKGVEKKEREMGECTRIPEVTSVVNV